MIPRFTCPSRRRMLTAGLSALLAFGAGAGPAMAADYPDKPIKVVLMFPPGGGSDGQTRLIAEKMKALMGQTMIIDNRPGGGGIIAANAVKSAPADGYTLLHAGVALMTLTPRFNPAATYSQSDFVPVAAIATAPPLLAARADFPANNLKELVALSKAGGPPINYGTWGPGSVPEVAGEWLNRETGMKLAAVPYKGEVPVVQDMLGDQLALGWVTLPTLLPHLKAGKFKVLAVASEQREPLLPQVPTFIEQGVPDFVITGWTGIFALKGTPPEVVKLLNAKINEALKMPDVQSRITSQGQQVLVLDSARFGELVKHDAARLAPTLSRLAPSIGR